MDGDDNLAMNDKKNWKTLFSPHPYQASLPALCPYQHGLERRMIGQQQARDYLEKLYYSIYRAWKDTQSCRRVGRHNFKAVYSLLKIMAMTDEAHI